MYFPVADPDLQIKRAGGHPDPEIRGGGGGGGGQSSRNFFWPFGPQFGLKIRGGRQASAAPPLDPPLFLLISGRRKAMTGNMSGFESYINRSEVLFLLWHLPTFLHSQKKKC